MAPEVNAIPTSAVTAIPPQVMAAAAITAADWTLRNHGADHDVLRDLLGYLGVA